MAKRKDPLAGLVAELAPPPTTQLSPNHDTFARHYARYGNATLAYHIAYPEAKKTSCAQLGSLLLRNIEIQKLIEMEKERNREAINFTREDYFRVIYSIASNPYHKQQRDAANDLYDKLGLGNAGDDSGTSGADARRVSGEARQLAGRRKAG